MIGRKEETALLKDIATQDRSQFVVVYGRRRVGKTYLIRETFDYDFAFQHTGMEGGTLEEQLGAFRESLEDQGYIDCPMPKNWIEAFGLLKKFLKQSTALRKIIFMDELPWMDTVRSRFVSALENFWNGWCSARKDIVLIVCGSATSWMVKKVLRNKGGLFNRANRVIYLEPFTLGQCEEYLQSRHIPMERYEIVLAYMIFGGIPYYWSLLDTRYSLVQNIDRLCFTTAGELVPEFKRLYSSVFSNGTNHLLVVKAMAERNSGVTREEIVATTKLPNSGKLSEILEELEESGFIRQYMPIGKKKKGIVYQLIDNFTLFYLKFMAGKPASRKGFWSNSLDTPGRHAWEGLAFERVCFWHESQIKAALGISGVATETASWRSARKLEGAQIDMLIDRRDGVVNVCEMKFSQDEYAISADYASKLRHKLSVFKEEALPRGKSAYLTMIATYGIKRNEYSGMVQNCIVLDDLFKE